MTTTARYGALWLFVILLTIAQTLFKVASRSFTSLPALLASPALWVAIALYGVTTLLWIRILQLVPLSRAYLFAALTYVFVPAVGFLALGERLTPGYGAGSLMILGGIVLMSRA